MQMKLLPERSSGGVGNSALAENPQNEFQTCGSGEIESLLTPRGPRNLAANCDSRWAHRFLTFNLIALLLVAAVIRCRDLGRIPGINGDEAWYGVQVEKLLAGRPINGLTPTGNVLNPFLFGPQLFLHWLFGASFALLRTTSVLSGLAAVALNYWLCRPIFGRRVAVVSTVILAVLPIDIAYSRLAWDTAQSVLFTLPAVYLPLRAVIDPARRLRWSLLSVAALGAAFVVHPTNIFAGPIMAACLGYAWRHEMRAWWSGATMTGQNSCSEHRRNSMSRPINTLDRRGCRWRRCSYDRMGITGRASRSGCPCPRSAPIRGIRLGFRPFVQWSDGL